MKKAVLLTALLVSFISSVLSSNKADITSLPTKKLEAERGKVNYDLNEMIKIIEDSIRYKNQVITPEGVNEFERLLFTARRKQHNDSQLVAISLFQNLLEFEYYRHRGEELYIQMLLAKSLDYIGADQIAHERLSRIFPELIEYIESPFYQAFFLDLFSDVLVDVNRLEEAIEVYHDILEITIDSKDSILIYDARNNLGFTYIKLNRLDSASYYLRANQNKKFKKINPTMYAFSFGNYADVHFKRQQIDSVVYYLKKEERLLKQIPSEEGMPVLYQGLAKAYDHLNQIDSSIYYYELSNEYSDKYARFDLQVKNYQALIDLQARREDQEELKASIKKYLILSDSVMKRYEEIRAREELKISEFFRIYSSAIDSKEEYEILKRNNQQLYMVIISLAVLMSILLMIMLYRYYSRKQLAAVNQDLQKKNRDLAKSNEMISESNQRNELLLKELHHRVKNNLQIVNSLFRLQMNAKKLSDDSMEVFQIAQDRIHSISLLHNKIYQSENITELDFSAYLKELAEETTNTQKKGIKIQLDVPQLNLSIDTALPLGLIFNELFTNSIKHAKVEEELIINLNYQKQGSQEAFLYTDNGTDYLSYQFMDGKEGSLGKELVTLLSQQLEAELDFQSNEEKGGFRLKIIGDFSHNEL